MQHSIWKKGLVLGIMLVFLGASTTLGINASITTPQLPRVVQQHIQAIKQDVVRQPCLVGNVKVSPGAENDYHPRMTTNAGGDIIIVYEQEEDSYTKTVPVVCSADEGNTWTQQFLFNSLVFQGSGILAHPDIIYNPAKDLLWFVAVDPHAEMYNNNVYFIPGDIAHATEATGYAISGSTSDYYETACTHTNDYFLSFTTQSYSGYLLHVFGLVWFAYPDYSHPPGLGGFYSDDNSLIRTAPVAEIEADYNTNRWFVVAESGAIEDGTQICIKSGTTDRLLITSGEQKDGMDKYGDISESPGEFLGLGTNPDVSGSGSNVAVVFVRDGNILCSISSCVATYEPEFNWHTTVVEIGGASTPAVYMQGNNVYCAYVKGGNLYLKVSEDGGTTWGAAEQKNDIDGMVVAEKDAVDICKSGIAFTDKRNGNYDIYFSSYAARPTPELAITGLAPMKMTIKNLGNAPAFNVSWSITVDGGFIILGRSSSGILLGSFKPGQESTVGQSQLLLGFGYIEIIGTAWADNAPMISAKLTGRLLLFFFHPE
jgi:hypothetical protein